MTALDWNSALEKEAPEEFMHVPQPCACALSRLCCECRRPQRAATFRCLEWADVYSPPYRVLKDIGWHVATVQPACPTVLSHSLSRDASVEGLSNGLLVASLYLALSFINNATGTNPSKKDQAFFVVGAAYFNKRYENEMCYKTHTLSSLYANTLSISKFTEIYTN